MIPKKLDRVQAKILEWGEYHLRDFPWREQERPIYDVFIAEFFLTQTPPRNVDEVYPRFLERYATLTDIDSASASDVRSTIQPLGFQSMRADALKEIARTHDRLPTSPSELQNLPRVGRYVANATVCFSEERALPIVDRNVDRIYERLFPDEYPSLEEERWDFAASMLPESGREARLYNLSLIDYGSLVCTKSSPSCDDCILSKSCEYREDLSPRP